MHLNASMESVLVCWEGGSDPLTCVLVGSGGMFEIWFKMPVTRQILVSQFFGKT